MTDIVSRKVLRVGSSIGLIIPKDFATELGMEQGDEIEIELCQDGIVVTKVEYEEDEE